MAIKITPYVGGGVDIFTTKKDNEGAYLGTEETFGFHANNGLLYLEGAAIVSQTRKNIDDQKTDAKLDRYGLDVSAGIELPLKNIIVSLGPYAEMGIMRGQAPFGSGLSDPFVTPNTYVGAGAQLGLDLVMKGKKIDFTAGLRARAGYRSIGVSSIYFDNNIGHSIGGSAFGAGLRFSIGPGTISDDTESESTEGEEMPVEGEAAPLEAAPAEGVAPGEAVVAPEGATPPVAGAVQAAPGAPGRTPAPAVPGRTPVPVVPGAPGVPGAVPVVPPPGPVAPLLPASQHPSYKQISAGPVKWKDDSKDYKYFERRITGYTEIKDINKAADILLGKDPEKFKRIVYKCIEVSPPASGGILSYVIDDIVNVKYKIKGTKSPPASDGSILISWVNVPGSKNSFDENKGHWKLTPVPGYKDLWKIEWYALIIASVDPVSLLSLDPFKSEIQVIQDYKKKVEAGTAQSVMSALNVLSE